MKVDFIAQLKYNSTEEGGRSTPAMSGYRPAIKFEIDDMLTSGSQTFIDKEIVYPGEYVMAEIKIIAVPHFKGRLKEGMTFTFNEGTNLIGTGTIKKIINKELITAPNKT